MTRRSRSGESILALAAEDRGARHPSPETIRDRLDERYERELRRQACWPYEG